MVSSLVVYLDVNSDLRLISWFLTSQHWSLHQILLLLDSKAGTSGYIVLLLKLLSLLSSLRSSPLRFRFLRFLRSDSSNRHKDIFAAEGRQSQSDFFHFGGRKPPVLLQCKDVALPFATMWRLLASVSTSTITYTFPLSGSFVQVIIICSVPLPLQFDGPYCFRLLASVRLREYWLWWHAIFNQDS